MCRDILHVCPLIHMHKGIATQEIYEKIYRQNLIKMDVIEVLWANNIETENNKI